jgi:hypothetical protein
MSARTHARRRRAHRGARGRGSITRAFAAGVAGIACACATYPQRTAEAFRDFERGRFDEAGEAYADKKTTGAEFLAGAEAGMAALADGDWDAAQQHLDRAADAVKAIEERALIGAENLGEGLLALAVNESFSAYEGEGYERVQLHTALALTYLARGDLDGVYVEVRRANKLLESEETLYETEYAAGGLGHFVSAACYELQGRYDDAFIDYRRMEEKGVGLEIAGPAMTRIAARLGFGDELPRLEARFGAPTEVPSDAASIIVIAGVGIGPFKVENTLPLPTPSGILQFSVPSYVDRPQPVSALELRVAGASAPLRTSVVEDIAQVAQENLEDRLIWLAARSALRGILKRELTKQLEDKYEVAGRIAGDIFAFVTERADLRAWQTLPDSWQVARMFVAPGEHEVELAALGGESRHLGRFRLDPGETLFVIARSVHARLYAYPIGGARVDRAPEPAPSPTPTSFQP